MAVIVRDHGVGLRPGEAALVFNRFWRAEESRARRSGGTGLGLSISVEDARLHGGWLQAWGEPGRGCRVPAHAAARRSASRSTVSPLPLGAGRPRPRTRVPTAEPVAAPSSTSDAAAGSVPTPASDGLPVVRGRVAARPDVSLPDREEVRVTARALLVLLARPGRARAGCASVPDSSPVQVLRQVGDGDGRVLPPGPVDGSNPLDLVRGFVYASGSSADRHGAARRFLAPEAADWDDGTGVTVLDEQFDTVYAQPPVDPESGTPPCASAAPQLGRLTPAGAFEAAQAPVQVDVDVVRRDGQWRIARLPGGVARAGCPTSASTTAPCKTWFVDPVRQVAVADLRYVPGLPAGAGRPRDGDCCSPGRRAALAGAAASRASSRTPGCGRTSRRARTAP